jgi:hypothetical protein
MKLPNYNFSTLLIPGPACILIKVWNFCDKRSFYDDFTLTAFSSFPRIVRNLRIRIQEPR